MSKVEWHVYIKSGAEKDLKNCIKRLNDISASNSSPAF